LALLVTAASRAIDRKCTGVPDAVDYFKLETVTGEVLVGQVDYLGGSILCYPHKPIITSVTAFSYQASIVDTAYTVDPTRIRASGPRVTAYPSNGASIGFPSRCDITISYIGGLATSGSALPSDLQECAAILAARFYREAETGLNDQIGVAAELSTMVYTKAWPVRVTEQIQPFIRRVGWRHVA
jgi:hypothetical protein